MSLSLSHLLEPVAALPPCGVDLRRQDGGDAVYFQMKDWRASARSLERLADADEDVQSALPYWQRIRQSAITLLEQRTKDLEVAVWLTEAEVRLSGFGGLRDGFGLLAGLVERFWPDLFPRPDQDGLAARLSPLGGLNGFGTEGTLIQPIRMVPLVPAGDGKPAITYWHYQLSQRAALPAEGRPPRPDRPRPPDIEELRTRMVALPEEARRRLVDDVREARAAFAGLDRRLTDLCGAEAPPSSAIGHILEEIGDALLFLTGATIAAPSATGQRDPDAGRADDPSRPVPAATPVPAPDTVTDRETALRQLEAIGRFFRRTEPHSPLSYSIEDLVRRGRMSWPDLLAELLQDQGARNSLLTAAGIRPPQS